MGVETRDDLLEVREQLATARLKFGFRFELERREFCKLLGGGLMVFLTAGDVVSQEAGRQLNRGEDLPASISAWLHVAADGSVTVYTGKVEMGQNIRTSLTQQVAEELHVPPSSIQLIMGDTALTPYDMGTFGAVPLPPWGRSCDASLPPPGQIFCSWRPSGGTWTLPPCWSETGRSSQAEAGSRFHTGN